MKIVGVTGGIGSGKSTICAIFQALGVPTYNADSRSKWLQENHPDIIKKTITLLGSEAYLPENKLNRSFVAQKVFSDKTLLYKLNAIVHPVVRTDFEQWCLKQLNTPYVIKESALLLEPPVRKQVDCILVVTAPENVRLQRVLKRDPHRTESDVKKIMGAQISEDKSISMADFHIPNGDQDIVLDAVLHLHQKLSRMVKSN